MRNQLAVTLLALLSLSLAAQEETIPVTAGELQIAVDADGTIDSADRKKIKIQPQEFVGPYTVLDAAPNNQRVEKDAVILRLDTSAIERILRATREGLDANTARLPLAREEFENLKASNKAKLDKATYDLGFAERDRANFNKFGEEQLVKSRELAVKQWLNFVADREEELEQLESMYKDTKVASQTKEIVLERSRRSLALSREQLESAKKADLQMREYDLPHRKEQVILAVDNRKLDLELLKSGIRLGEIAKSDEIVRLERTIRDQQEYLARLDADLPRLTVKAPIAGMLLYRGVEPGDKVAPNVVLMEVVDPDKLEVRFQLLARDFRAVKLGDKVTVRIPDMPELELDGKIDEIAWSPAADDKGVVRFAIKAKIDGERSLRPGLRARVEIRGENLKNAVSLPRHAVTFEDNRTFCKVRAGDKTDKREIVLGLGNKDRVHVVKGLKAGDVVIVEKK